jgi:hypothetical protein
MPIRPYTGVAIACDIRGEEYDAAFTNIDEARRYLADTGWIITADEQVICDWQNPRHQAAIDQLLPTKPDEES